MDSGLCPDPLSKNSDCGKLSLMRLDLMSLGLSSIVILILGCIGVAGVNDMMVGDTWFEIIFRRAGDADRLIHSEGLGVLHSS